MTNLKIYTLLAVLCLLGCSSSGPKTQYYSLFADQALASDTAVQISLGVGPVILPDFLSSGAIVSRTPSQQVRVSGVHVWAGPLDDAIVRVLVGDLSSALGSHNIQGFPWDARIRPEKQLRIEIEDFSGVRGGKVNLTARWSLVDANRRALIKHERVSFSADTNGSEPEAYVAGLNDLLHQFARQLTKEITQQR
ncbi:PqiC family protein [Teredinibacter sp. KSP-S5-2]|uniref:PqiC family protein n=1 Tax=Teredinibacter sp. KSP-S5-2 TaxID=3034506 RepID=UPI0029341431|nr:PqiC family protein [Teredinibacter sp. KSP-S5-2]WNO08832.1 PqiC family protein [Teredinibacter sp. KSP-S5-2]